MNSSRDQARLLIKSGYGDHVLDEGRRICRKRLLQGMVVGLAFGIAIAEGVTLLT